MHNNNKSGITVIINPWQTSGRLHATTVLLASRFGALLARSSQHLGAQQESLHQSSLSKTNQKVPFSCLKEQTHLPRKRLKEQTRLLRNCWQRRSRLTTIPTPWDTSLGWRSKKPEMWYDMRDLWKWQTQIKNRSDSCNLQRYIQATVTLIYLLNIFTQAVYMNVFKNEAVSMNIFNNEAVY